ncbi:MAG: orotidine-5'-phosphate decarboxylase [Candidatus Paceibacterota bacterium]
MIIDKYNQRAKKINSLLCVGLDSDFNKIPERFKMALNPQFEFNKWIIKETHKYASAFKMNSAFYEARGDKGIQELKMTIDYLNKNYGEIFTILDAKRADVDNTNQGYVEFVFNYLNFDAITLNPYLGGVALSPFLDKEDKGCIILCRTSNSGAGEFQDLEIIQVAQEVAQEPFLRTGKTLWQIVAEKVSKEWNKNNNCMLVVGATYPEEMKEIRNIVGDMTFLVPGIGTQGGDLKATIEAGLNSENLGLIIHSARSIIFAKSPEEEAEKLCEEIRKYKGI